MKYMLTIFGGSGESDAAWELPSWSPEDIRRMVDFMHKINQDLVDSGEFVDAQGLSAPSEAKVVRASRGDASVTDGPFAEAKEVVAGFWLLDVASEERVLEIAARISATPGPGGALIDQPVEVRPIGQAPA